jgi:hypothetical protein
MKNFLTMGGLKPPIQSDRAMGGRVGLYAVATNRYARCPAMEEF